MKVLDKSLKYDCRMLLRRQWRWLVICVCAWACFCDCQYATADSSPSLGVGEGTAAAADACPAVPTAPSTTTTTNNHTTTTIAAAAATTTTTTITAATTTTATTTTTAAASSPVKRTGNNGHNDGHVASEHVLVYIHVPKSAGLYVQRYLRASLGAAGRQLFVTMHADAFLRLPQDQQAKASRYLSAQVPCCKEALHFNCTFSGNRGAQLSTERLLLVSCRNCVQVAAVAGHFGFGLHASPRWKLNDHEPRYMTVLREPIARLISQFQFETLRPRSATDPVGATDVLQWLRKIEVRGNHTVWSAHNNPVTQQLCCADEDNVAAGLVGSPRPARPRTQLACAGQPVTEETLACAKRNLVGIDVSLGGYCRSLRRRLTGRCSDAAQGGRE